MNEYATTTTKKGGNKFQIINHRPTHKSTRESTELLMIRISIRAFVVI